MTLTAMQILYWRRQPPPDQVRGSKPKSNAILGGLLQNAQSAVSVPGTSEADRVVPYQDSVA